MGLDPARGTAPDVLQAHLSRPASPWLRRLGPASSAPVRLVCFPHAGGSAVSYVKLAHALSPTVDTHAVQYPGRFERRHEPLPESITAVADAVVAELAPSRGRPTALFGHSMGSVIAFEVARRLEAMGCPPTWLFVSGSAAPSRQRRECTHLLDDPSFLGEVQKLGGTDRRLLDDDELMQLMLPVIRADSQALESYRYAPGPPLRCPVTALNGQDDPKVRRRTASAWRKHTTGRFRSLTLRGGHFYLVDQVPVVAAVIEGCLAAQRPGLDPSPRRETTQDCEISACSRGMQEGDQHRELRA
jgi:surfactin synthase thioesterase subunit